MLSGCMPQRSTWPTKGCVPTRMLAGALSSTGLTDEGVAEDIVGGRSLIHEVALASLRSEFDDPCVVTWSGQNVLISRIVRAKVGSYMSDLGRL